MVSFLFEHYWNLVNREMQNSLVNFKRESSPVYLGMKYSLNNSVTIINMAANCKIVYN